MKETTAVATISTDLIAVLTKVENKLNMMKESESVGFKTHGGFRWNPSYTGNAPINIHTNKDLGELLNIYASLSEKEKAYNLAAEENGLSEYPVFTWQETAGSSWIHDLKLRISALTHHVKKQELLKLKSELSQFMTKEDKLALILNGAKQILE